MERRKWLTWAVGQEVADKIYDNIERSKSSDNQCCFISSSFYWGDTEEGSRYWYDINLKIQAYLNDRVGPLLISFLKERGLYAQFINNFNPLEEKDSYDIINSFIWLNTKEGYNFWSKVNEEYCYYKLYDSSENLSLIKKSKNDENQLQGKEDPRREGDGSERSGVCCERDEPRFRLSYTQHRKRIDFQKREVRDFKVNLSTRYSIML